MVQFQGSSPAQLARFANASGKKNFQPLSLSRKEAKRVFSAIYRGLYPEDAGFWNGYSAEENSAALASECSKIIDRQIPQGTQVDAQTLASVKDFATNLAFSYGIKVHETKRETYSRNFFLGSAGILLLFSALADTVPGNSATAAMMVTGAVISAVAGIIAGFIARREFSSFAKGIALDLDLKNLLGRAVKFAQGDFTLQELAVGLMFGFWGSSQQEK